jgi:hypothetical protein
VVPFFYHIHPEGPPVGTLDPTSPFAVTVRYRHWATGTRRDPRNCAIARALREARPEFGAYLAVGSNVLVARPAGALGEPRGAARCWCHDGAAVVSRFDAGRLPPLDHTVRVTFVPWREGPPPRWRGALPEAQRAALREARAEGWLRDALEEPPDDDLEYAAAGGTLPLSPLPPFARQALSAVVRLEGWLQGSSASAETGRQDRWEQSPTVLETATGRQWVATAWKPASADAPALSLATV